MVGNITFKLNTAFLETAEGLFFICFLRLLRGKIKKDAMKF
jgi:hypothetical protein